MAKKKKTSAREAIYKRSPTIDEHVDEFTANEIGHPDMMERSPTNSDFTVQQLRISPYTEAPIALHIGSEEMIHYVAKDLVPPQLRMTGSEDQFYLHDVNMGTGHTLVHYLYTGTYETLHDEVDSSTFGTCVELKRALLVYVVASNCDLPDLQQLSMCEI